MIHRNAPAHYAFDGMGSRYCRLGQNNKLYLNVVTPGETVINSKIQHFTIRR